MTNKVFNATMENLSTRISDIAIPDITLETIETISHETVFDGLSHWAIFYNSHSGKVWVKKYPNGKLVNIYNFPDVIEIDRGWALRLPEDIMSAVYDSLIWLSKKNRGENV